MDVGRHRIERQIAGGIGSTRQHRQHRRHARQHRAAFGNIAAVATRATRERAPRQQPAVGTGRHSRAAASGGIGRGTGQRRQRQSGVGSTVRHRPERPARATRVGSGNTGATRQSGRHRAAPRRRVTAAIAASARRGGVGERQRRQSGPSSGESGGRIGGSAITGRPERPVGVGQAPAAARRHGQRVNGSAGGSK